MNLKKLPKTLIVFLLFIFSSIFQLLGLYLFKFDIKNLTTLQELILVSFSELTIFFILILIYFKDLIKDLKKLKNDFNKNMDIAIKYWLLGFLIMVVSNIIIGLFITKAKANNEAGVQELITGSTYISIIIFGIIAPFVEEVVFRKSFRDVLTNDKLFIITAGLIFGGLHVIPSMTSLWDLFYLIPYCSLGIAFSMIYQKTDNIFYSMFVHMLHNTGIIVLSTIGIGAILW